MAESLEKTGTTQIIAGAFTDKDSVVKAVEEFRKLGYFGRDIQVVNQESPRVVATPTTPASATLVAPTVSPYRTLTEEGIAEGQSVYYTKAVEAGKTVLIVYRVTDPAPVIDVFNRFGADYNPNGSRNLRDDVAGMTLGAAAGAIALGAAGAAVGGPIGAAVGATAGAVAGGVAGGAVGVSAEHSK